MQLGYLIRNVQVFTGLCVCLHQALSTTRSGTYQKFALADEPRYRNVCQPAVFPLQPQLKIHSTILCYSFCIRNPPCTIFSIAGDVCSVWSFQTDPSYEAVTMPRPTVVAYGPKRTAPVTVIDVAMGKNVSTPGAFPGYARAPMLTAGTTCYKRYVDCFVSKSGVNNWLVVDLQASLPVRTIVFTGPFVALAFYFTNVTVRAGETGLATDPVVGITPSTAAPVSFKTHTITIAAGNVRYIRLKKEHDVQSMSFCKVQAFL